MKNLFLLSAFVFLFKIVYAQELQGYAAAGASLGANDDTSGRTSAYTAYPFKNSYFSAKKKTADCGDYISNQNGLFGYKGLKLQELMYKYPVFYKDKPSSDIKSVCPNFSGFTENQKVHFWVWFWSALSLDETTCGADTRAQGVNDQAVGDFQMEESIKQRRAAGRPEECMTSNISKFSNNASCAVAIFAAQLENKNKIFGTRSYWQKLNVSGGGVESLTRKYPGCR